MEPCAWLPGNEGLTDRAPHGRIRDEIVEFVGSGAACFGFITIQLPPLLLGPAKLLHRGGQVEEVDRHYGGPGPEVGIADESVELPAGFDDAGMNEAETVSLFCAVAVVFSVRVGQS